MKSESTMLAGRLVRARQAQGLNREAAAQNAGLRSAELRRYERGEAVPSAHHLALLGQVYGVRLAYFLRQTPPADAAFQFRKRALLRNRRLHAIEFRLADSMERWLELASFFPENFNTFKPVSGLPPVIDHMETIDFIADHVRAQWELGLDPILDMTDLLEIRGVRILSLDIEKAEQELFDGAHTRSGGHCFMVVGARWPGDRQRFTLAHELGHLLLQGRLAGLDEEKVCNRFAGAFLLPGKAIRQALGNERHQLEVKELSFIKQEYRISMQAVIFRAQQSGIISAELAQALHIEFRHRGWRKLEPGEPIPSERALRFEAWVYRALAEDLISESKAAELLDMPLTQFRQQRRMSDCPSSLATAASLAPARPTAPSMPWLAPHRGFVKGLSVGYT